MKYGRESLIVVRDFFFLQVFILMKTFSCDIINHNRFTVHKFMYMPILTEIKLRILIERLLDVITR